MLGEDNESQLPSLNSESLQHILTHDILNHLTVIRGNTEVLLSDIDDPDIAGRLDTIKRESLAVEALISTVGDQSRGSSQMGAETVNISDILNQEIERVQAVYTDADITTNIDDEILAVGDDLLMSAFANLLENAIKHNGSADPTVHVDASEKDQKAVVTVEDNGPGVSDEVRHELQGDYPADPNSGTHIINSLIERAGGEVTVETSDGGTTVTIELPKGSESP